MSGQRTLDGGKKKPARSRLDQWADFADLVLEIAREIQFRGYASPEAVQLVPSEGTVMRYLLKHPGALPSQVALATGLQRTNLSTVLRGLEEKKLIERIPSPDDGRSVRIYPTPRVLRNYSIVRQEWASWVASASDDDPAVENALPLLQKVHEGLVQLRQQSAG